MRGTSLHVREWGPAGGPPVLCLHGVTSFGGRFRRLAERRLGAFRVLAPDLRGHGLSDWEPPWDLPTHVADLLAVLDDLDLDRVDVVGHSFGGRLGLEVAAAHPERVSRLVLLDPAVWVPPPIALERAEALAADESFGSVEEAVEQRLRANPHAERALVAEDVAEHLRLGDDGRYRFRCSRSAVVAAYGEMAKPPPLDRVEAPNLLVRAVESDVTPEALAEACRETIGSIVVVVPGGHVVLWDAFDETADAVAAFLEDSRAER